VSSTCAGFVRQKRGKKVPSFIKQKVASSSNLLCLTNPALLEMSHPAYMYFCYLYSLSKIYRHWMPELLKTCLRKV
jgi:hypothetical protein